MSNNKTVANNESVDKFISSLSDAQQVTDSRKLVDILHDITGKPAVMWGGSIIGFGQAKLTYASGREVDWPTIAFSPRKGKISLYVTFDAADLTSQFPALGSYKIGKGCIYINKLADVDEAELRKLVRVGYEAGFQSPDRADGREQIVDIR